MSKQSVIALLCVFGLCSNCAAQDQMSAQRAYSHFIEMLLGGVLDKELDILDSQRSKLVEIRRERQNATRDQYKAFEQLTEEERRQSPKSLRQLVGEVDKNIIPKVQLVLLPHQESRGKQIALQMIFRPDKSRSLLTDEMAEKLKLDDGQSKEIQRIFAEGEREREEADKRIKEKREKQLLQVLSPQQRKEWVEAFGDPFPR